MHWALAKVFASEAASSVTSIPTLECLQHWESLETHCTQALSGMLRLQQRCLGILIIMPMFDVTHFLAPASTVIRRGPPKELGAPSRPVKADAVEGPQRTSHDSHNTSKTSEVFQGFKFFRRPSICLSKASEGLHRSARPFMGSLLGVVWEPPWSLLRASSSSKTLSQPFEGG